MLGQTVVAAIIYGFVGTDWTTLPNRLQPGPKLPSSVISDRAEAYLAKWSNPFPHYHFRP